MKEVFNTKPTEFYTLVYRSLAYQLTLAAINEYHLPFVFAQPDADDDNDNRNDGQDEKTPNTGRYCRD